MQYENLINKLIDLGIEEDINTGDITTESIIGVKEALQLFYNEYDDNSQIIKTNIENEMTDYEYDKLYDELVELEKETNMTLSNSPTINVEPEVLSSLEQVEHPSPMLSLSKTKQVDELFYISKLIDIDVICYGLRTNFKMEAFEGSKRLLEIYKNNKNGLIVFYGHWLG